MFDVPAFQYKFRGMKTLVAQDGERPGRILFPAHEHDEDAVRFQVQTSAKKISLPVAGVESALEKSTNRFRRVRDNYVDPSAIGSLEKFSMPEHIR